MLYSTCMTSNTVNWTKVSNIDFVGGSDTCNTIYTLIFNASENYWMVFLDGSYLACVTTRTLTQAKEYCQNHADNSL